MLKKFLKDSSDTTFKKKSQGYRIIGEIKTDK